MLSRKILWILSFLSYIVYATAATELGPALLEIRLEFNLSETTAGALVSLQSLSGVLAIFGGILSDVFGKSRVVSLSLLMMGVGIMLISSSPLLWLLGIAFFIFGSGAGFFEASANALVSDVFSKRRGMALTLLHIGWTIGSTTGPLLIAFTILNYGSWRLAYMLPFPLLFFLSLSMWLLMKRYPRNEKEAKATRREINFRVLLRMLPIMSMPFLLVASQLGMTAWLPSILLNQKASIMGASLAVGLFWALSGVGRLVWAPFIDRFGYWKTLTLTSGSSALLMLLASSPFPVGVKIFLWSSSGLLLGPAYPTVVAWATAAYPEMGGTLSGVVYTFATLGSFISTIATGVLLDVFGPTIAQLVFPGGILLVAVISYAVRGIAGSQPPRIPR